MGLNKQKQVGTKVPAIRFDGYTDEWGLYQMSEVVAERREMEPECEMYPLMSFTSDKGVTPKSERYDRSFLVKDVNKKYKRTKLNDLVYSSNNLEVGSIGLNSEGNATISPVYSIFHTIDGFEPYMFGLMIQRKSFINSMIRFRQGVMYGQYRIHESDFLKIEEYLPKKEEQSLIGNFFKTIDDLISAEKEQFENYEQYKEAMLQKMFPKKGEVVPEVRFDGYTDEWAQTKLGDVIKRKTDKGRSDIPLVTVSEHETAIRTDGAQGYGTNTSKEALEKSKIVLDGEFLIDLTSYSRGIYRCRMDGLTSNAYHVLELIDGDIDYWTRYFVTHNFVQSLKRITPPGARQGKMIEVASLLNTMTPIPPLEEQVLIGNLFKTIDDVIRVKLNRIDELTQMKESFLQKMFV